MIDYEDISESEKSARSPEDSDQYGTLFESLPHAVLICDPGTLDIVLVNSAAISIYGYSREEFASLKLKDLCLSEDGSAPSTKQSSIPSTPHAAVIRRQRRKDGAVISVEIILRDTSLHGKSAILVSMSLISERMREELVLGQNEERYRSLIDSIGEGYWELDLFGKYTFFNDILLTHHARSREQLIGLDYKEYMDEENARRVFQSFNQVYRTGAAASGICYEIVGGDGIRRAIEANISLMKDGYGKPIGFRGTSRDISERIIAEEALKQSEERYRIVLEEMTDSFWETDLQGRFTFFNNQTMVEHRRSREEMEAINRNSHRPHLDNVSLRTVVEALKLVYDTGQPVRGVTHESIRGDGSKYAIESNLSLIRDADRKPVGFRGITRDVTQRVQTEKALERAKEAAEATSRSKSEFLANMSHEIRTPMNGIIGMTELALGTDLTPEQREYLNMVRISADSLLSVINDVLDFSKVEAGKLGLDPVNFYLRERVEDTMTPLALRAHEKAIELVFHITPDVPDALIGDPGRLRQIITNLVGNAIKFTSKGEVVLTVQRSKEDAEEGILHFSVTDTGIGIPAEKQQVIFEAFSQVDGSNTRKYGGTGLGLTISTQLVAIMGGKIWVESQPGLGSTFHFTCLFGLQNEATRLEAVKQEVRRPNLSVLVVDDNATNRQVLQEILRNWEMLPTGVDGSREALEALRQARKSEKPFDLVLLDAHMPEMNGFDLAALLQESPDLNGPTVMMVSSAGDAVRCREVGVAAYLTKPVKQSELSRAIQTVLAAPASKKSEDQEGVKYSVQENKHSYHILLAEDNAINQRVAVRLLEKRGHKVTVAGNGHEAVAGVAQTMFDFVLMDIQMPELNGYEATAAIREREKASGGHMPIIAMTAHAMKGDRERCLDAGMDGYVSKPINTENLFKAIEELVSSRSRDGAEQPLAHLSAEGVLDKDEALLRVDGDLDLLLELAGLFAEEYPHQLLTIREAISRGDSQGLEYAAHSLKGSVSGFGAKLAYEAAMKLEMMGREGQVGEAAKACESLTTEIERLHNALGRLGESVRPTLNA